MLLRVLHEAVAVQVAEGVDPAQRRQQVGPDRLQQGRVAGAAPVGGGQHQEQRRGVHGAVVAAEGDFAGVRHLAGARLVQDLARFGVAFGIGLGGLAGGEEAQHAARGRRVDPQVFERGQDAVAPEGGGVPGDAGEGIGAGGQLRGEHRQVRHRAVQPQVDQRIGGAEAAARLAPARPRRIVLVQRLGITERARRRLALALAGHGAVQVRFLAGVEPDLEAGASRIDGARRRVEAHARSAAARPGRGKAAPPPSAHLRCIALAPQRAACRAPRTGPRSRRRRSSPAAPWPHPPHGC